MVETIWKCDIFGMTDTEGWIYQRPFPSSHFSRDWKNRALCYHMTGSWQSDLSRYLRRESRVVKKVNMWLSFPFIPFPCFEAIIAPFCSQGKPGRISEASARTARAIEEQLITTYFWARWKWTSLPFFFFFFSIVIQSCIILLTNVILTDRAWGKGGAGEVKWVGKGLSIHSR